MMANMQRINGSSLDPDLKARAEATHAALGRQLRPKLDAMFAADGMPKTLSHYTDFAGLKGILETGSLWATYGRVLNDSTEHRYGLDALRNYAATKVRSDFFADARLASENPLRNFVTCFCDNSHVLSMWRAYAAFGGGYCLEFDGEALLRCSFPPHHVRMPFKMEYGRAISEPLADLLETVCAFANAGQIEAIASGAWLALLALKVKHPAFHEEREWRIVIQAPHASTLRFRCGLGDIKPYIELRAVTDEGAARLPLKRVVYGPNLRDDDALVESIDLMLETYGYSGVKVEPSGIPYRR